MENILNNKSFTTTELEIINACRLYLQVSRRSDIATMNGKRVLNKMLSGEYTQEDILEFRTTYTWPHQERPNPAAYVSYGQKLLPAQSAMNLENFKEHLAHGMQQWKAHGKTGCHPHTMLYFQRYRKDG
eukprot:scaffold502768_cov122-Attheya_sp.AAC.1